MPLVRLQTRRDTAANWTLANPVLSDGEPGRETDTGKLKIGDGIRNWASLPYLHESGLASSAPPAIGTASAGTATQAARQDHTHALPANVSAATVTTTGNVTVGGDLVVTGALTTGSTSVPASSVTGLSEAVDDRVASLLVAGTGISLAYDDAANSLSVAVGSHTQAMSSITGLEAALSTKAATGHSHQMSDVDGLAGALSKKVASDITGITGSFAISNVVALSQVAYDSLTSKSATTLYVIQ